MESRSKICDGCGKPFFMASYDWPKNFAKRQFCGWQCARLYGKKRQPGPILSKVCVGCGKTFYKRQRGLANWLKRTHCTTACALRGRERDNYFNVKHGKSADPVYKIWNAMRQRCQNPKNRSWHRYGGRGITVCDRWSLFQHFVDDMGPRPNGGTLDRINNDGNYEPSNCRWATRIEQQNNIEANRILEYRSERMSVRGWERRMGYKRGVIASRLRLGWTAAQAIMTPPYAGNKPHHRREG